MNLNSPIKRPGTKSLRSLQSLSDALDIPISDLVLAKNTPYEERYKKLKKNKINGDVRDVYDPIYLIRRIQKKINNRIFKELILWPEYIYGSIPTNKDEKKAGVERHYIACAKKHCQSKTILKVDMKSFFDNIHKDIVIDIFKRVLKFKGDALDYLVDICCYHDGIVQGALTSSYLASLCLFDLEGDVFIRAKRKNLVYTRLVDDITVSSKIVDYDMGQILQHIRNMLAVKDLPINEVKTKVHNISTESLKVHGLRVSFSTPRLPSTEVGRIRSSVHNLEKLAKKNNSITSVAYRLEYNRCVGRVNKLGRLEHNKHKVYLGMLRKIIPKASLLDVDKVTKAVRSLETSFNSGFSGKRTYERKYNITVFNLIILRRTEAYKLIAEQLNIRLARVKP